MLARLTPSRKPTPEGTDKEPQIRDPEHFKGHSASPALGQAKFCFPELWTPLASWELTFDCKSSFPSILGEGRGPYTPCTGQPGTPAPGSFQAPGSSIPTSGPHPRASTSHTTYL